VSTLRLDRERLADFAAANSREWLVTNGLGGYAAGTAGGATTRRYHGLLVAALRPPVERVVMVAKLDAIASYRGQRLALTSNEYVDGTVDPHGYRQLAEFRLEGQNPVWRWVIADAVLEARLWMAHGRNTSYLSWALLAASAPLALELAPLCTYRDYHWHSRGARDFAVRPIEGGIELQAEAGARSFRILAPGAELALDPQWHWQLSHREERQRGLDDGEDLLCPARFRVLLAPGEDCALTLDAEATPPLPAADSARQERTRQLALLRRAGLAGRVARNTPREWRTQQRLERLVLAADQFVVERRAADGTRIGESVIAGYPWFSDWGRDTMIALPGLTLATGRPELAASVLRTFARFVDRGMLPNRFPDAGEAPEYNTVDATLWYFVAVEACWRASGDRALIEELYPVLRDIVDWHRRGTRYGIGTDPADGLLAAGEPGVQLTWMDAKLGDHVVTPRIGKAVEINALWFNALRAMQAIASCLGEDDAAGEYAALAAQVQCSFTARFWYAEGEYLYDVIDGPEGEVDAAGRRHDASLRPNQIFAVSLPHPLLDGERARAVVRACARALWTPVGLRSLDPADPRYRGRYAGGVAERDGAYHQGTVWSWLLGPFVLAHLGAFGDPEAAGLYLDGLDGHLLEGCLGQISEIMDGDAPHAPRGCVAQAWSVAETLRAWRAIDDYRSRERTTPARTHGEALGIR